MLRVTRCGAAVVEADGRPLPDTLLAGRQGRLVLGAEPPALPLNAHDAAGEAPHLS